MESKLLLKRLLKEVNLLTDSKVRSRELAYFGKFILKIRKTKNKFKYVIQYQQRISKRTIDVCYRTFNIESNKDTDDKFYSWILQEFLIFMLLSIDGFGGTHRIVSMRTLVDTGLSGVPEDHVTNY